MSSRFIFVVCQQGAESVCKSEILANHPELRFSFSRPGFITFKCDVVSFPERFHLKSTFARTFGWSIGNSKASDLEIQCEATLSHSQLTEAKHLHIWQRDQRIPGTGGFEPGINALSEQLGIEIAKGAREKLNCQLVVNRHAKSDERIFDIVLVDPDYWFFGYHDALTKPQRWPGGVPNLQLDGPVISRAYFKLKETLLWSGIHIKAGDLCAEIGSSPGGACQLLLEKEARVLAIDPAETDPLLLEHENFEHLRCRSKEVRKKELRDVRWLISDLNVAPNYALDSVEEIVTNQHVNHVRGLMLTLKLADWKLADEIPSWIERVKKMGFQLVKTRQLAFNRREICMVAVRDRFALRSTRKA